MSTSVDEAIKKGWVNWANKWDQENPSDFKKACNESRARQKEAEYQREYKERMARLFKEEDRIKLQQEKAEEKTEEKAKAEEKD